MTEFSKRLKQLRLSRNYSLDTLSKMLNDRSTDPEIKFSRTSLNRWERDEASPSVDHAKVIAALFGVTLDELAGITELDIKEPSEIDTIAAHIDENATDEQKVLIYDFIKMITKK